MWDPSNTLLGTHTESETFSHTIEYSIEDEITMLTETYKVRITPQETNPNTISFVAADPGVVSGHYGAVFNDQLTVRGYNNDFTTLNTIQNGAVFDVVDKDALYQVISYKADTSRSRTFHYTAEALDEFDNVIATENYTIICQDLNWTTGKNALKDLVAYASSK